VSAVTSPLRLDRTLLRISGPDAAGFLQNLLTQNVERLEREDARYAALLSPQGKVICDMLLWADGEGVIAEADAARGGDLARRLTMYKLRAQVAIEDVTSQRHALYAPSEFEGARPDPRFPDGALGWRAIGPASGTPPPVDGRAAYEAHRLTLGVPDLARDAAGRSIRA
jgi:folate-binding Fe-S cluster repair protein YgfZ